ncbi:MAG: nucleotidyltransferase [Clostridiaceae bacterium]
MKIAGIITEYNPFHSGHELHLKKTRSLTKCDAVVCVMSGNFVQRGAPALIDKWTRTEMALENGVDLILELPAVYAVSSAEFFASGAISILNSLKVIDSVSFGSECGDIELLKDISSILHQESPEFRILLKKHLDLGFPIQVSRSKALIETIHKMNLPYDDEYILKQLGSSNNILGIEYIKAISRSKSRMAPFTFRREGADYNNTELQTDFSSASSIRKYLKNKGDINSLKMHLPEKTFRILEDLSTENYDFAFEEKMFKYLKYKILTEGRNLSRLPDVSEGLDNKIIKEIENSSGFDELILNCKSKRYTYTRLSRILTQFFAGFENYNLKELRNTPPEYIRILGLSHKGAEILKLIKKNSSLHLVNKIKSTSDPMLSMDIHATKAYSLICSNVNSKDDFLRSPVIKFSR